MGQKMKKTINRGDFAIMRKEVLPDGRIKYTMKNGAIGYAAPHPRGEWMQRKACEIADIQYERILREMKASAQ